MNLKAERPPNFDQIVAAFPDAVNPGVIFAYGDTIYNPSGQVIPPALMAHESVHCKRQLETVGRVLTGPEAWWSAYTNDVDFRYGEELLAHVAEFKAQATVDRNHRATLLMRTAQRLIAQLYQYPKDFTLGRAMCDISRLLKWK